MLVPGFVLLFDVVGMLAAGMSIRFFPIFFLHDLGLSPVAVNGLAVATMGSIAALGCAAQSLAKGIGRVEATILFKAAGACALIAMAVLHSMGLRREIICAVYVLRSALMNATSGLTKSIIHDNVPQRLRARYASVDSVNQATCARCPRELRRATESKPAPLTSLVPPQVGGLRCCRRLHHRQVRHSHELLLDGLFPTHRAHSAGHCAAEGGARTGPGGRGSAHWRRTVAHYPARGCAQCRRGPRAAGCHPAGAGGRGGPGIHARRRGVLTPQEWTHSSCCTRAGRRVKRLRNPSEQPRGKAEVGPEEVVAF